MSLYEFDIIKKYFTRSSTQPSVEKSVGDDCAILTPSANKQLVMSMDTLVAGRHFPESASPYDIATRALCTSVSDLAAMGAKPLWFTLGLTLPDVDEPWLQAFSEGLFSIADQYAMDLIGGDTTQGALTITVQVHGEVEQGKVLCRDQAQAGDKVFVTGFLGDGAAALAMIQQQLSVSPEQEKYLHARFYSPLPQISAGLQLAGIAHAGIDISDGLLADAQHIANASGVSIELQLESLPQQPLLVDLEQEQMRQWMLSGGDDYQLLFTVNEKQLSVVQSLIDQGLLIATQIGTVCTGEPQVRCYLQGEYQPQQPLGYQHFAS